MMTRRRLLGILPALVGVPAAMRLADGTEAQGRAYEMGANKKYLIVFDQPLSERALEQLSRIAVDLRRQKGLDLTFMADGRDVKVYEMEASWTRG